MQSDAVYPAGRAPSLGAAFAWLASQRMLLAAFFGSRAALLAVGLLTQVFIAPHVVGLDPEHLAANPGLSLWGRWDSIWYLGLAQHGYAGHPRADGMVNWVFFPAFPLLSAGLARLTGLPMFAAMVLLSNTCFLAALVLIRRFARAEFDQRTADISVALICVVPGSYVFSSAYTESLFLLGLVACLLQLKAGRWMAAGAAAALVVLTRNVGMGLALPFALTAGPRLLDHWREIRAKRPRAVGRLARAALQVGVAGALPALALAGFCLVLYLKSGDPFAFVSAQKAWNRGYDNPLIEPLLPFFLGARYPQPWFVSVGFCWLSLAMLVPLALMRRWSLLALACFLALVPMSAGMNSFARYTLVNLPLFLAAANLLAPRPAVALAILLTLAMINGFMMVGWTLGLPITA